MSGGAKVNMKNSAPITMNTARAIVSGAPLNFFDLIKEKSTRNAVPTPTKNESIFNSSIDLPEIPVYV